MADLAVQNLTDEDGGVLALSAADALGDKFVYHRAATVVLRNTDVAVRNVTVTPFRTSINDRNHGELTRTAVVVAVPAGATAVIPPLPDVFRHRDDANKVHLTYDATTNLSVAIMRVA